MGIRERVSEGALHALGENEKKENANEVPQQILNESKRIGEKETERERWRDREKSRMSVWLQHHLCLILHSQTTAEL